MNTQAFLPWRRLLFALIFLMGSSAAWAVRDVQFTWDPNPETDLAGYNFYYFEPGATLTNKVVLGRTVTTHTVVGLVEGRSYTFFLTAFNASNLESESSAVIDYTIPLGPPPPMGVSQSVQTPEDTSIPILLSGIDAENDPLTFILGALPANGQLTGSAPNLLYTPNPNFSGTDQFTFRVNDGTTDSIFATVTITVTAVNDAPTLSSLTDRTTGLQTTIQIPVTFSDDTTPPAGLVVTATSGNQQVLPDSNVAVIGSGAIRVLSLNPVGNTGGTSLIVVTVRDEENVVTTGSFTLTVIPNQPPVISAISDVTTPEDVTTAPLSFTVSDDITPAGSLIVVAASGNPTLIDPNQISITGSGGTRVITMTPGRDQTGTATVVVTAVDAQNAATTRSFRVTVNPVPDAPTIDPIGDQVIEESETLVIPFVVNDPDSDASGLVITLSSTNLVAVPVTSLQLGGSGSERTLTFRAPVGVVGTSLLSITASDGALSTTRSFLVHVTDNNAPPLIGVIPDQILEEGQTSVIPFSVSDRDTDPSLLQFQQASSNADLLPITGILPVQNLGGFNLTLIPVAGQVGTSVVTLFVTDGQLTTSRSFQVTVMRRDVPPVLVMQDELVLIAGLASEPVPLVVADDLTPPSDLEVSVHPALTSLIPSQNVEIGGSGSNRFFRVTALRAVDRSTLLTVTVRDGSGNVTSKTIVPRVVVPNLAPEIGPLPDVMVRSFSDFTPVDLLVADPDGAASDLRIELRLDNERVISSANTLLTGEGFARTIFVIPNRGQSGDVTMSVRVSDAGGALTVRSFRLRVVAPNTPDFNGDRNADFVLQNVDGPIGAWAVRGTDGFRLTSFTPNGSVNPGIRLAAASDMNGDEKPDLVFQSETSQLFVWTMDGFVTRSASGTTPSTAPAGYRLALVTDVNGDGDNDFVFQTAAGVVRVWQMRGRLQLREVGLSVDSPGAGWRLAAASDLDRNGSEDLVFEHTDGSLAAWLMDGATVIAQDVLAPASVPGAGWHLCAAHDENHDGVKDLVFQHADGSISIWFMNGLSRNGISFFPTAGGPGWRLAGAP